jgi:hypothetical protein
MSRGAICPLIRGVVILLAVTACGQESPSVDARRSAALRRATTADDHTVTLITGDRVTVTATGPVITPAPGRGSVTFAIEHDGDQLLVTPTDAMAGIAAGRLDPALFNITQLLEAGYGDGRRDDIPLILTGQPEVARAASRLASAGLVVDRALPTLHAMAVRQPKARAGAALAQLTTGPGVAGAAGAGTQIWLDRRRTLSLDHSVPQIGGPTAHARGFTGAGVVVAVLDSGIDSAHPDLAGKVIAAENFTDDGGDAGDVVGHATHVASIIAGSGAASGGQLRGAAPDAQLLNGRVCDVFGCADSWILAGMEWAVVEHHARIVNVSLGGNDTPALDPLEQAIEQLSAQFGTLFVVAAGNDGFEATINSPGSADAALTVGAVDREGQLAEFSSRGPRAGDHAIKPDVTAPGVDIVAARAANVEPIGEPVGESYQALSGTSMATPHVAGAAALLLQQHPDWTGAELKAQLVGTAEPAAGQTAFEQGAGQIDVDRATRQAVTAEPPSLSLGLARWPHTDDPLLVRTVTYHNRGAAPITLALAASLRLPDGTPAAPGLVRLSAATLDVPAGGTADVVVTVDTNGDGLDGSYTGALVARSGDLRVETPLAVEREVESYDVTFRVLDVAGAPGVGRVAVRAGGEFRPAVLIVGEATLRLPSAIYAIDTIGFGASPLDFFFLAQPRFEVSRDTSFVIDGRLARATAVTLPDAALGFAVCGISYEDFATGHRFGVLSNADLRTGHLGPELPPDELLSLAFRTLGNAPFAPSVIYNLAHHERGHVITGWTETVAAEQLATVKASHAGSDLELGGKGATAILDEGDGNLHSVDARITYFYGLPFDRTELYYGPGFRWVAEFEVVDLATDGTLYTSLTLRDYRAGRSYAERWNVAPFGPAFVDHLVTTRGELRRVPSATRVGDTLTLTPSLLVSRAVPARDEQTVAAQQRITLRRDGQVIAEVVDQPALPPIEVPPGPATYRFEQVAVRSSAASPLSTRVEAAWTFRSQHVAGARPRILALPTLRFEPALDDHNATAARVIALPVRIERPPGAAAPPIVDARLEVSFDDGARWARVPLIVLGGRAVALIAHRPGAAFVSLRGALSDAAGNRVEQTIVRAYGLTP